MSICEQFAYKENDGDSMIRNKFRLRFERAKLINYFAENTIPRNCNNVVYIINEI